MTPPAASHAATGSFARRAAGHRAPLIVRVFEARSWIRLRFTVDAVMLAFAAAAAVLGASGLSTESRVLGACFPLLMLVLINLRPSRDDLISASVFDSIEYVAGITSIATMVTITIGALLGVSHNVALALRLWVYAFCYVGIARALLLSIRRRASTNPAFATPTLIVGAGIVGDQLVRRLTGDGRYGLRPVGFIDPSPLHRSDGDGESEIPLLGGPERLLEAIELTGARQVIVAFSPEPDAALIKHLEACRHLGVEVALVPRMFELVNERSTLDRVGGVPLVYLRPTNPRSWQFAIKHTIDRAGASLALLLLAPAMVAITLAVRLSSTGPILFRQRRVGRDGREFDLLKFRTMRDGYAEDTHEFELPEGIAPGGVEGPDRRTALGRLLRRSSLDELPQLINVVRGEMSIVGPRPERPEFVERFSDEVDRYDSRHRVKSGITGWAQVSGLRGQTSISDRVEWDNYYIQNWSLRFDLRIIAMTILELLRFRG
jgi:exopolysaccharide biosynthesis polyprenyl glycosylphosphotransferase